ncbi:SIMPL domain-containing protein [bacterium]|nr:SIMPL domain-containing protein [bacterium]
MNKRIIWIAGFVAFAALLVAISPDSPKTPRTIAVTGECLTTAPKDRTAITLRVTTLDKSAAASMKQASEKIAQITEYLKTQDVKMQTTQFDSYEKTEWDRVAQKTVSLGIETNIAVEVSATSIDIIEGILTKFAGMPNVYSENLRMFTSSEAMQPVMEECLGVAVENARTRANALAAGDGRRAGKMLAVEYGASGSNIARPTSNFLRSAKMSVAEDAAAYSGGGIVSQDTQVTVNVSAVFEIR